MTAISGIKQPGCDCIKKALNQWAVVDGITSTTEVYYLRKGGDKGYQEESVFLLSNFCPMCGEPYHMKEGE